MVDERRVESIRFIPHDLQGSLNLCFDFIVVGNVLELEITFFDQGEF